MFGGGVGEVSGRGVVNHNDTDYDIASLWVFRGSSIYVAQNGTNLPVCGSEFNPCLTVDVGVSKLEGGNRHIFVMGGEMGVKLRGRVDLSGVVLRSSARGMKGVVVVGKGCEGVVGGGLMMNREGLEVTEIKFVLSGSIGCGALMESSG